MTVPEFFRDSVNRFGTHPALASKNGKKWEMLNFTQYYEACRKAARSLIKVRACRCSPAFPPRPAMPRPSPFLSNPLCI